MDATIIICTRNRGDSLARTLASIEAAERPVGFLWELIVVDNGSTDNTAAVLADFAMRLPLKSVTEPKFGLSNARNRGVEEARGRYIIWTDDDVVVQPRWLPAYVEAFRRWPEATVFGGPIVPVLEEPVVSWFAACREQLAYLLAACDFGDAPLPLSLAEDRLPFGANYAVRTAEQRRFAYDPERGAAPGRNRMGEESMVIRAILGEGGAGYYVPEAAVHHMIAPGRQTIGYIRSYYRAHGETAAMTETRVPGRQFAGLPLWLWRQLAAAGSAYTVARAFSAPAAWVRHLKRYSYWSGYAEFLRGQAQRELRS